VDREGGKTRADLERIPYDSTIVSGHNMRKVRVSHVNVNLKEGWVREGGKRGGATGRKRGQTHPRSATN